MDFEEDPESKVTKAFEDFFDDVIIPASQRASDLDPRISVSSENASEVRECTISNKRILDADHRLIIIGAGPAGMSAAVYAARAELEPLVVAKDGGQLESTSWIDNYPGFADGVDAVELVMTLQKQAERFGAVFQECTITRVDLDCRPFRVHCDDDTSLTSRALIVATGARAKWLGVPGELELLSKGVHTCATCDGFFYKGLHAAVIGGGDTAMEQALFLARLAAKVTVIHRRESFRASKAMATRVLNHPNIEILWDTTVEHFVEGPDGTLATLRLGHKGKDNETVVRDLKVDGAFVAIGHVPNTQLFESVRKDTEGYIYTIPGSTVTSVTGIYAAGDVQDHVYRQAITSAGTGAMAAMDAERWLCEHGC